MSSGSPSEPAGMILIIFWIASSPSSASPSLLMLPGSMPLMVTLKGASSSAAVRMRPDIPALVAE